MEDEGKMKAVASVTFDGEFVVHDIKIVKGLNGLFVAMPSKKIGDKYKDVAHPLLPETREKIANAIFRKYEETFNEPVDAEGNSGEEETVFEE
ncbi:MAG: SpoVG family protein [Firmicutes bacterium]|nr:SpoVG family protein [Bacillota bacterium]